MQSAINRISNNVKSQWLHLANTSAWKFYWQFPISFSSWGFTVQVTHVDSLWQADQTTRVKYISLTGCDIGGNQENGMEITATATGY